MYRYADYTPIHDLNVQATLARVDFWKQYALFTWQWWVLTALFIISIFVWWKLVDKNRLLEIVCYGAIGAILTILIDTLGTLFGWYAYPITVQPYYPGALTGAVIPIIAGMLIYQYYSSWRDYLIAGIIASASFAFVSQPIMTYVGIYKLYNFSYTYSFVILMTLGISAKLITEKVKAVGTGQ